MQLQLIDPSWINDAVANHADQCAHGKLRLVIGETVLIDPIDGEFAHHSGFAARLPGLRLPHGIELDLTHHEGTERVHRRCTDRTEEVAEGDWRAAVLGFAAQVQRFYDSIEPKLTPEDADEREAWSMFWAEWRNRTGAANGWWAPETPMMIIR